MPLNPAELRTGLRFFSRLDVVETTGSTNADLLARAAADPAADREVLIAEEQTGGRGRHARAWASPPRAQIAMSMLLRLPGIAPARQGWLPLLTGVAVVDALRTVAQVEAELKWPNDVLIAGRKVAGILVEVVPAAEPAVVVGVGLNVSLAEAELPVPQATSLAVAGSGVARGPLVAGLLAQFAARFTRWQEANWDTIELAAEYRERCATLGIAVRAELPGGTVRTGHATGVDADGRLLIDGHPVSAGDVTHLRPA